MYAFQFFPYRNSSDMLTIPCDKIVQFIYGSYGYMICVTLFIFRKNFFFEVIMNKIINRRRSMDKGKIPDSIKPLLSRDRVA